MTNDIAIPDGYALRLAHADEAPILPGIEDRAGEMFADSTHPDVVGHEAGSPALFLAHIALDLCFVAIDDGDRPVAFATAGRLDEALHLYELSVDPKHGHKGLGRALIERVCEEAMSLGIPAVTLSTFTDVPWNAPFYERVGFRILDPADYTPALHLVAGREEAVGLTNRCIMRRDLGA